MTRPTNQPAGRPPIGGERKTVTPVRLTQEQLATARRLGNGNASAGIRAALDSVSPDEKPDSRAPAGHQHKRTP